MTEWKLVTVTVSLTNSELTVARLGLGMYSMEAPPLTLNQRHAPHYDADNT